MNRPSRQLRGRQAFTLIELLVVISIIALLISILLPALTSAKRRVRLLQCMTNLQQLGIGFATYYTEHGDYPPNDSGSPGVIYWRGFEHDIRDALVDICNGNGDIYWDPLAVDQRETNNPSHPDYDRYGQYFRLPGGGDEFQSIPYAMWVLGYTTESAAYYGENPYDFTHSGNPPGPYKDHRPRQFGNSDTVIISDYNVNWSGHCPSFEPGKPCYTQHNDDKMPFIDGNRLYADGHAVSYYSLTLWIERPTPHAYYDY